MPNANAPRPDAHISRRTFAERLALAAAAPFVLADLSPAELVAAPVTGIAQQPSPQAPEPSALAKALVEGIRLRWPDRFSADDLAVIARSIDSRLQGAERLYQVSLANGDEPDFVYSVFRGPDR
jgi:hypothetical protein